MADNLDEVMQADADNQPRTSSPQPLHSPAPSHSPGSASDAASFRALFPIFQTKTYLNSCSQGALSTNVRDAYNSYLEDWNDEGSPWEYWVERNETAREAFAGLVNAESDEIAVMTSLSAAVSALASAMDYHGERDKIVVSDYEFPTVAQIWHAQERRGARIEHVPTAGNIVPVESFEQVIDERTALVSITHVSYRSGSRQDVEAIVELAHERGALVLLDSYQALGSFPIDVKDLKVDFLVGGVLKYLLASPGLAFMYTRKDLLPYLHPTVMGWFSQANIFAMDIYANTPSHSARKFESGTPPIPNIYAAIAGIKLIQSVGLGKIESHLQDLTGALKEGAMRRGFNLVSPVDPKRHGAMITLRSHKVDLLVDRMSEDDIIVSKRDDNLRISLHYYNNLRDIDLVLDSLTKHKELLV